MKLPFRKTLYNCKEATLLSIKEEEVISVFERVKLAYHLLYCEPCRRFIDQWRMLSKEQRRHQPASIRPPFTLRKEAKERMQEQIDLLKP